MQVDSLRVQRVVLRALAAAASAEGPAPFLGGVLYAPHEATPDALQTASPSDGQPAGGPAVWAKLQPVVVRRLTRHKQAGEPDAAEVVIVVSVSAPGHAPESGAEEGDGGQAAEPQALERALQAWAAVLDEARLFAAADDAEAGGEGSLEVQLERAEDEPLPGQMPGRRYGTVIVSGIARQWAGE